jgi:hypothetical protein
MRLARVSPSMVVAMLALFVAMGGTAVAAKSFITGKQIKNSSITGVDIKNKSLTAADIRGQLRGLRGLTGAAGPPGAKGDKGDPGRSALSPLQPGESVYGTIGAKYELSSAVEVASNASLPVPAPVALDDAHVNVDGSDEGGNLCTGTSSTPTAPAGHVCVYPYFVQNVASGSPMGWIWGTSDPATGSKWGFQVGYSAAAAGPVTFFGTWAYTAP